MWSNFIEKTKRSFSLNSFLNSPICFLNASYWTIISFSFANFSFCSPPFAKYPLLWSFLKIIASAGYFFNRQVCKIPWNSFSESSLYHVWDPDRPQRILIYLLYFQECFMHAAVVCSIPRTKSIFFQASVYFHRDFCWWYDIKQRNVFRIFRKQISAFDPFTGCDDICVF